MVTELKTSITQQINIPNKPMISQAGDTQKESSNHNPEIHYSKAELPRIEKACLLPLFVLL